MNSVNSVGFGEKLAILQRSYIEGKVGKNAFFLVFPICFSFRILLGEKFDKKKSLIKFFVDVFIFQHLSVLKSIWD